MDGQFQPLAKFIRKGADINDNSYKAAHIAVMSRYDSADIPKDYQGVMLDNSPVMDDQEQIYEALDAYVATFTEDIRHKNVYLYSKAPGTGKTTTAIALLNEWIRRRFLYHAKNGEQVPETLGLFMDVTSWQNRYNMATMTRSEDGMQRISDDIQRYSSVPLLVCDDLGVRGATEAFRGYLHTILNARVVEGKPTIYTSNEPMDSLKTVFDDRLYDRVRDQAIQLNYVGESHRGRRTT